MVQVCIQCATVGENFQAAILIALRGTDWGVNGYFYIDSSYPCGIGGDDMGLGSVNALPLYVADFQITVPYLPLESTLKCQKGNRLLG